MFTRVLEAAAYAAHQHRNQKRKGANPKNIPYINHPLDVATLLAKAGAAEDTIIAGLLHDTVEDTGATFQDLAERFGTDVAGLVAEVTDDKSLSAVKRKKLQIEHAKTASPGACLIKLADKLNNLSELTTNPPSSWTIDQIRGYFVWARRVIHAVPYTNGYLESLLAALYASSFVHSLNLPHIADDEQELQAYYALLEKKIQA